MLPAPRPGLRVLGDGGRVVMGVTYRSDLGGTHWVHLVGPPFATYVRTYGLTKNHLTKARYLTSRNAREKSDEIRDSEHGDDRTPGCAHCITLNHLPTKETT